MRPCSASGFGMTWKWTWKTCWNAIAPLFYRYGCKTGKAEESEEEKDLKNVVVDETHGACEFLCERKDLGKVFVRHLIHSVRVD